MSEPLEKIQYFGTDLSYALDIGPIADMHVETLESGVQVLRITCLPKEKDEYKTVKVSKPVKSQKKPRASSQKRETYTPVTSPASLSSKLAGAAKRFLDKPMKRPDQW